MKKIFALLIALMMVFALAACGNNETPSGSEGDKPGTSQGGESNNGGAENNGGTENNGGSTGKLPEGLQQYVGQYPFLADLVFPDDAN
ncbi:MAG: hypothetical protein IJV87_08340, partial [Clostridia bacterium]|nr:hypothetical protein [Clostridia bacterium]